MWVVTGFFRKKIQDNFLQRERNRDTRIRMTSIIQAAPTTTMSSSSQLHLLSSSAPLTTSNMMMMHISSETNLNTSESSTNNNKMNSSSQPNVLNSSLSLTTPQPTTSIRTKGINFSSDIHYYPSSPPHLTCYDSDDEMVRNNGSVGPKTSPHQKKIKKFTNTHRTKKGHPIYSREDIREQYCINLKELDHLEEGAYDSSKLFGCLSSSTSLSHGSSSSPCNKTTAFLTCVKSKFYSSSSTSTQTEKRWVLSNIISWHDFRTSHHPMSHVFPSEIRYVRLVRYKHPSHV